MTPFSAPLGIPTIPSSLAAFIGSVTIPLTPFTREAVRHEVPLSIPVTTLLGLNHLFFCFIFPLAMNPGVPQIASEIVSNENTANLGIRHGSFATAQAPDERRCLLLGFTLRILEHWINFHLSQWKPSVSSVVIIYLSLLGRVNRNVGSSDPETSST